VQRALELVILVVILGVGLWSHPVRPNASNVPGTTIIN
jgi:hypothetical protein